MTQISENINPKGLTLIMANGTDFRIKAYAV